ncbi:hypothetical protein [Nocardia sp. NPDC003183]
MEQDDRGLTGTHGQMLLTPVALGPVDAFGLDASLRPTDTPRSAAAAAHPH